MTLFKLALAAVWGHTNDITQTRWQAEAFLEGRDLLDPGSTGGNPSFFLLGHYATASVCLLISRATGVPFAWAIKWPAILADGGVAWLLMRRGPRGPTLASWYLLNPVTFLLSVFHGQLHTVAMALAVLALHLLERTRLFAAAVALALAASVRQHFGVLVALLALPPTRRGVAATVLMLAGVAVLNAPLLASARPARVLAPTWTYGSWGYTLLLQQGPRVLGRFGLDAAGQGLDDLNRTLARVGPSLYWVWAAAFLLWLAARSRRAPVDPWHATTVLLLGLYAVSPGFGVQWLVWVVPFWLITQHRAAAIYSGLAGAFIAGSYWQWTLNARYGVSSITANLDALAPIDAIGLALVGVLGVATWAWTAVNWWRLVRQAPAP